MVRLAVLVTIKLDLRMALLLKNKKVMVHLRVSWLIMVALVNPNLLIWIRSERQTQALAF